MFECIRPVTICRIKKLILNDLKLKSFDKPEVTISDHKGDKLGNTIKILVKGSLQSTAGAGSYFCGPFKVPRGPDSSQKGKSKAKNLVFNGLMWPAGRIFSPSGLQRPASVDVKVERITERSW
jgi:hypothetical protein